ncbi:MAG: hypothetical protein CL947_03100 [Epsilonproteobacteria bacterium]|nr:hypothetical protein [Campylobacterota bacterium]
MKIIYTSVLILCFSIVGQISSDSVAGIFKGIGNDFESFGKTLKELGPSLARGFGAAPTGYTYNCVIVNDTDQPIYAGIQEYSSFMGSYFKKSDGWSSTKIAPYSSYSGIQGKQYYFELQIDKENRTSGRMPYEATGALYLQDCIQLPKDKNTTKTDYFHVYTDRTPQNGVFAHVPKVELIGYIDSAKPKDSNAITLATSLTSNPALVVYNNTNQDLLIGYSYKSQAQSLAKTDCNLFLAVAEKQSFLIRSPMQNVSGNTVLDIGTLGIFQSGSDTTMNVLSLPQTVFDGKTYTVEVYEVGNNLTMGIQGLVSPHDIPTGKVRDVTPVTVTFWYQSIKDISGSSSQYVNLPGTVWMISQATGVDDEDIKIPMKPGQAFSTTFTRPASQKQRWFYFLYIDEQDANKEATFIDSFLQGKIGSSLVKAYKSNGKKQLEAAKKDLSTVFVTKPGTTKVSKSQIQVPQSLLVKALQGALDVKDGSIYDISTGVTGYLLGGDVFLSQGLGAQCQSSKSSKGKPVMNNCFYYTLAPATKLKGTTLMSTVINEHTLPVNVTAAGLPKGMPQPKTYVTPSPVATQVTSKAQATKV